MKFNLLIKNVLSLIPVGYKYEIFYQFARFLGIGGFLVDGRQGLFLGAVSDRAIMRSYLLHKEWSSEIIQPIRKLLENGGTFVDVGANIGLVSLAVSKNASVNVISIEPDDENFKFLKANIAMHGVDNITAINAAAWHEDAELSFERNSYNSGDHHLGAAGEFKVKAFPLDQLALSSGPIAVKIDTQGAEPAVLQGATALLSRVDLLIIEFWPWGMSRMGLDAAVAIDILSGFSGKAQVIDHGNFSDWMTIDQMRLKLEEFVLHPAEVRSIDICLAKLT